MKVHRNIRVRGIVQGVGFRPFIFTLAEKHNIAGTVCNDTEGVSIAAEGFQKSVDAFIAAIRAEAPPLAHIIHMEVSEASTEGYDSFSIVPSRVTGERDAFYSPDVALCDECLKEFSDPSERRYHYPFITCTHCGPRLSIVYDIPYDRHNTAMKDFPLCDECRREYEDPHDRRFHTQPLACPVCGPHLKLMNTSGEVLSEEIETLAEKTVQFMKEGKIIAIKGVGGYLLAADATHLTAAAELRRRKARPFKPFAIMVSSIEEARKIAHVSPEEEKLLISKERPILLLEQKENSLSAEIAPGLSHIGMMLPYLPFQYHLFSLDPLMILIMTSGNMADEPIIFDDAEAMKTFSRIADYIISYNREIVSQNDDSVLFVQDEKPLFVRRSRGYVPLPFGSAPTKKNILALGGDLKNSFALARSDFVILSQYLGDMAAPVTQKAFRATVNHYMKIFDATPEIIVSDEHPGYMTTAFADELAGGSLERLKVQHHHAHALSVMEDRGIEEPVIAVIFDGTGYGRDGKLWGSEILLAERHDFQRLGHLGYFPLPGGEKAIRDVYKIGIALLYRSFGDKLPLIEKNRETEMLMEIMAKGINSPETCSVGRIFDGVSSLLGIRRSISTEAEAAILLEEAARGGRDLKAGWHPKIQGDEEMILPVEEIIPFLVRLIEKGEATSDIAMTFHHIIADAAVAMALQAGQKNNLRKAVLSGGSFHNRILLGLVTEGLRKGGFTVFWPHKVPVNDGCIALGQVAAAKEVRNF